MVGNNIQLHNFYISRRSFSYIRSKNNIDI